MKYFSVLLFTAVCLYSCNSNQYKIEGIVNNKTLNGKTLFIKERINREWKSIDSTIIEHGEFVFKGKIDTAKIAYIVYEFPENNKVRQAFVLENGKITTVIDTAGFMHIIGTKQNELMQSYQDAKNKFNHKVETFYKVNKEYLKTSEQKNAFLKEIDKFNFEEVSIDKTFAIEHINTLIGNYVFVNSFFGWSTIEKEKVIAMFNDATKKNKRIQEIIGDVEIEKKVAVGNKFVDIKLPGLNGDSIALSDLVGKTDYVLIDFWASWCEPCMNFLPDLKAFYDKNSGNKEFTILGVSLDENKEAWTKTVAKHQMTWKQVSDLKGWKSKGSKAYAVNSIPNTVLIDKEGVIVGRNLSLPEIEKLLLKKVVLK